MRVSIVTAAYNTPAPILLECWESIVGQTLSDWELLLVDDGSTDIETIAALAQIGQDPRVRLIRLTENRGLAAALNVCLCECRTELAARIDTDDIALPAWLERQVAYMDAHPEVAICGCQLESFMHGTGKVLGATNHPPIITSEVIAEQARSGRGIWFINHPGVIYRTEAIRSLGGYNPSLRRGQDFELWMRAFHAGLRIHNQPDVLCRYRRYC